MEEKSNKKPSARKSPALPVATAVQKAPRKTAAPKPLNRAKARAQGLRRQIDHADPWRAYHFIVALLVLIGALAGIASIEDLIKFIETRSTLEESGLVACVTIVAANFWHYLTLIARWFARAAT